MRCDDVRAHLDDYVSGELPPDLAEAIRQHVERCAECRAELDARQRMRAALQAAFASAPELELSEEFVHGLRAALEHEATVSRGGGWRTYRWVAAAAAVFVVVTAGALAAAGWDASRLAAFARAAWGDHRNCAVAFRLDEKPIALAEAASYDAAFPGFRDIPEDAVWTPDGDAIVTERHSCVYEGRRYAHIVMRYHGQLVSLLVTKDDAGRALSWIRTITMEPSTVRMVRADDGSAAATMRVPGHLVAIVGDLPAADLEELANELVEPVTFVLARS